MSTSTAHQEEPVAPTSNVLRDPVRTLLAPVQFAGFWSAVLLPLVLFPMLLSGAASEHVVPFVALVATNLVALVAGRNYNRN